MNALAVALNVPESYRPKAIFALTSLLKPLGISIQWIAQEALVEQGGFYYGIPQRFEGATKPIVALWVVESTLTFFEQGLPVSRLHATLFRHDDQELPVVFGQFAQQAPEEHVNVYQADLIASTFFWLSDWENVHRLDRDAHGRALYQGSLQQQWGLAYRCLVDEYRAVLRDWLTPILGVKVSSVAPRWYSLFTHDIDRIKKRTLGILYRELWLYGIQNVRKISYRERIQQLSRSLRQFLKHDAYKDSILTLVRTEHLHRIRGTYLFKSIESNSRLKKHPHDAKNYLDDPFFGKLLTWMSSLEHDMGYHSGYLAGYDAQQLEHEHRQLVEKTGLKPVIHRSHYLRYDASVLFPTLVRLGYRYDSSIAWADHVGSRTQTCHPHAVFDVAQNRELPIIEVPLMVMDTQLMGYMKCSPDQAIACIAQCLDQVKRHQGLMVWNFHHHGFDPVDAPGWDRLITYAYQVSKESVSIRCTDIERESILNT